MIAVVFLGLSVLAVVTAKGMVAIRRRNTSPEAYPITAMRYRHLNVVNRCDHTPACFAKAHEPSCARFQENQDG